MSTTTRTHISIDDYLTSDGKYPERAKSKELCLDYRLNAGRLIEAIEKLFKDLNKPIPEITSGFRTQAANMKVGGARLSAHCTCQAIDLRDSDGTLYDELVASIPLLEKHGLYMESNIDAPKWVHLQIRRVPSGNRVFRK